MSTEIPAGEGCRLVWYIRDSAGAEFRNVFQYFNNTANKVTIEPGDVTSWAANLWGQVEDAIKTTVELYGVKIEGIETFATEFVAFDPVYAGHETSSILPKQVAGLVTAYTAAKRRICHKYIPGMTETDLDLGLWTSSVVTMLQNFGDTWIEPFDLGTANMTAGTYSVTLDNWAPLTSAVPRSIPSTQRRRKVGVGV